MQTGPENKKAEMAESQGLQESGEEYAACLRHRRALTVNSGEIGHRDSTVWQLRDERKQARYTCIEYSVSRLPDISRFEAVATLAPEFFTEFSQGRGSARRERPYSSPQSTVGVI